MAASPHVEAQQIASLQRTVVRSSEAGLVTPLGNEISFETVVDENSDFTLRSFVYKPSLAAIVYMYCNTGGQL